MNINFLPLLTSPIQGRNYKALILLAIGYWLLAAPSTFAITMTCPTLPTFDTKTQCGQEGFFEKDGPEHIRAINKKFDSKLDLIFRDNIAHPTAVTKEIIKDLEVYHKCFTQLCQTIITQCSSHSIGGIPQQEYDWCQSKKDQFFSLQKAKLEYYVVQNTSRKSRSLFEEKVARIGYRFNQYIHSSSRDIIRSLKKMKSNISRLIKYPL